MFWLKNCNNAISEKKTKKQNLVLLCIVLVSFQLSIYSWILSFGCVCCTSEKLMFLRCCFRFSHLSTFFASLWFALLILNLFVKCWMYGVKLQRFAICIYSTQLRIFFCMNSTFLHRVNFFCIMSTFFASCQLFLHHVVIFPEMMLIFFSFDFSIHYLWDWVFFCVVYQASAYWVGM